MVILVDFWIKSLIIISIRKFLLTANFSRSFQQVLELYSQRYLFIDRAYIWNGDLRIKKTIDRIFLCISEKWIFFRIKNTIFTDTVVILYPKKY